MTEPIRFTLVGGPTLLIEVAGLRTSQTALDL